MGHVLITWEMGFNLGHLLRDVSIARKLRLLGHELTFAVRDPNVAEQVLANEGFDFLPAPKPVSSLRTSEAIYSYTDILIDCGYTSDMTLRGLVRAWLTIFRLCRPDVVIVDHSPTALLSARIAGIPAIMIGSGFEIPPNTTPFPNIRPGFNVPLQRLQSSEGKVLTAINAVLSLHERPSIDTLTSLFATVPALLTTFPELDHYGPRTDREYVGPIHSEPQQSPVTWPTQSEQKILVYLRTDHPRIEALMSAIRKLHACTICVIPKADEGFCRKYENANLRIHTKPIPLQSLMHDASVVVNYGGAGTITQALLQGVPLLLLPPLLEQHVGSLKAARLGAAIVMNGNSREEAFINALNMLLNNPSFKLAAQRFAQQYQVFNPEIALQRVVNVVTSLL